MTTTDANGIVFLEETDPISPFQTMINGLQQGTSDAIGGVKGVYQAYTPVITGGTTNPGVSTATGYYFKNGRMVIALVNISLTTGGSGLYNISLPLPGVVSGATSGTMRLYDSSNGQATLGRISIATINTFSIQYITPQSSLNTFGILDNVGSGAPWTWAAGDILDGFIIYASAT